jgi:hypothetical protein
MGNLRGLLGGAIATIGLVSIAPAFAAVITVPAGSGPGHFAPWTYNVPVEWVSSDPNASDAYGLHDPDANRLQSDRIFGVAVPEVPTWVMLGLGFAGLGFAAFRSPRPRRYLFP